MPDYVFSACSDPLLGFDLDSRPPQVPKEENASNFTQKRALGALANIMPVDDTTLPPGVITMNGKMFLPASFCELQTISLISEDYVERFCIKKELEPRTVKFKSCKAITSTTGKVLYRTLETHEMDLKVFPAWIRISEHPPRKDKRVSKKHRIEFLVLPGVDRYVSIGYEFIRNKLLLQSDSAKQFKTKHGHAYEGLEYVAKDASFCVK